MVFPQRCPLKNVLLAIISCCVFGNCDVHAQLRDGENSSLADVIAFQGIGSFNVQLPAPLVGKVESIYDENEQTDHVQPSMFFAYTNAIVDRTPSGKDSKAGLTLLAKRVDHETGRILNDNGSFTAPTEFVEALPDIEVLKSFKTLDEFVALLGPQTGWADGYSHQWLIFSVTDTDEISVMSVFLNHLIGNTTAPLGLSIKTGRFSTEPLLTDSGIAIR